MARNVTDVTPEEARAVWDSLEYKSPRAVVRKLASVGRSVGERTVRRWKKNGWSANRIHCTSVLGTITKLMDEALPALTGDPTTSVSAYMPPELPEVRPITDSERVRNHVRNVWEMIGEVAAEVKRTKDTLVVDNPAGAATIVKAVCESALLGLKMWSEVSLVGARTEKLPQDSQKVITISPADDPLAHVNRRIKQIIAERKRGA